MTHKLALEIKVARTRMQIKQLELAKILEISKARIYSIENDKAEIPKMTLSRFILLCKTLDQEFRDKVMTQEYLLTLLED